MNKLNIMKRFLLLSLGIFLTLSIAGCGKADTADFDNKIIMQVNSGRTSISQSFAFPANAKYFKESSDAEQINAYVTDLTDTISAEVQKIFLLNYLVTYTQNPDKKYAPSGDEFTIAQASYNDVYDRVEFSFKFNSMDCWEYYHPSDEDEDDGEGVFVKKSFSEGVFPFCQQVEDQKIGEKYSGIITSVQEKYFSQAQIEGLEKCGYLYDYVTYHKRVHSNADQIVERSGMYHHIWQTDDLSQEKLISLGTINAQRGWWYLVVIGAAILTAGVACLVIWLTEKRKNKKVVKKEG